LLALVFAGGAVAAAVIQPTGRNLRLALVGFAVASAMSLLILSRTQRSSSRSVARIEDRLHALEQRNRDEGDQLHRRVLEGMAREGQLFGALEVLAAEISRLRAALESLAQAGPDALPAFGRHSAHTAADLAAAMAAAPTVIDVPLVPLVQRIFAVQEEAPARPPADVPSATPAAAQSASAYADAAGTGSLGSVAQHTPAHAAADEAIASATSTTTAAPDAAAAVAAGSEVWGAPAVADPDGMRPSEPLVSSWVVRELQLEQTPDAPLPRVLDLTQPGSATEPPAANGEAAAHADESEHANAQAWSSSFARPA
jgi:hypothetical protein